MGNLSAEPPVTFNAKRPTGGECANICPHCLRRPDEPQDACDL